MYIIEPCCAQRHLRMLRDAIGTDGKKAFDGYGDMSITELLPAILTRYSETRMLIAAPSLPDQAAEIICKWMRRQWARMDGCGKLDVISELTVIADLSNEKSSMASEWLSNNPFPGRLTLVDIRQPDTVILLPDFAITGPVNMRYGNRFTAVASTVSSEIEELWMKFSAIAAGPAENPEPKKNTKESKTAKSPVRKKPARKKAAARK